MKKRDVIQTCANKKKLKYSNVNDDYHIAPMHRNFNINKNICRMCRVHLVCGYRD